MSFLQNGEEFGEFSQTMRKFATILRGITSSSQNQGNGKGGQSMSALSEFKRLNPPTFNGRCSPLIAEEWVEQTNRILDVMQAPIEIWVKLATFQQVEQANHWWNTVKITKQEEEQTWDAFKEAFMGKYFPEVFRDAMLDEFIHLTQGNMSVAQYEAKFESLSWFATSMISKEKEKTKWFVKGLKPSL